ncbi:ABC transporter permease [Streptomyces sp. NRRL S-87]|uniref:ABC transporter permease n=1 Tax=Streptomyces sp. NRRL S-87 TaxID=1463920 RepID=UPI0004C20327|nr:ABC transporter permease [Streptomyces sp. NRRL S-87]
MSAVWRAARAAVRRRRVQTVVIALVVLCSSTTVLLALALVGAASAPFDQAFAAQRGAHALVVFDASKAPPDRIARTSRAGGVEAAAGPFGQAGVEVPEPWMYMSAGTLTVVGRPGPGGPVDRVQVLVGRWARAPGEIVVAWDVPGTPDRSLLGSRLDAPGVPPLRVVGFATSMSKSASAWVTPGQLAALHPRSAQMLYRFTDADSERAVHGAVAAATRGLPAGAVTASRSYLTLRQAFSATADAYLPFVSLFGVLGLLVSVLIVGNVVSGAVVSGHRHIGVLKALGFTPNQVVAVYLLMVSIPAVLGCVLGSLLGGALAGPFVRIAFSGIDTGVATIGVGPWPAVACLLGMPLLVAVAALVPALRAHRLPAARAITAGSAPGTGRGLRVQRFLSGTPLPRAVSLGLGQPFARPGRSLLTLAAIALGVTTVTVTTGLTGTMTAFADLGRGFGGPGVYVSADPSAHDHPAPRLGDLATEQRLRALGARRVVARAFSRVRLAGLPGEYFADFYRGDTAVFERGVVEGRWPTGLGEVAAGPAFLTQRGLSVGGRTTLEVGGRRMPVTVVGRVIEGNAKSVSSDWRTLQALLPGARAIEYKVQLAPGADAAAYVAAVRAVDPGLRPEATSTGNTATATVVGFSAVFSVLLATVAALGVFNTVLLGTRERRRDLGMLKSIGMTPRQVVLMTVTSVTGPGVVGGLLGIPLGMAAHRLLVDHVGIVDFPGWMKDVWHAPQLAGMLLAGVGIAVLGALVPARSAARLTIARVLHNE